MEPVPGTTSILHFPVGVWLVLKNKSEKSTIPPGNIMLIYIFYQINMIIVESILLGGLKIRYEFLDVYGVDAKYIECRSDEDFILYDINEG